MHFGLKWGEGCGRGNKFFFFSFTVKNPRKQGLTTPRDTALVGWGPWGGVFLFLLLGQTFLLKDTPEITPGEGICSRGDGKGKEDTPPQIPRGVLSVQQTVEDRSGRQLARNEKQLVPKQISHLRAMAGTCLLIMGRSPGGDKMCWRRMVWAGRGAGGESEPQEVRPSRLPSYSAHPPGRVFTDRGAPCSPVFPARPGPRLSPTGGHQTHRKT